MKTPTKKSVTKRRVVRTEVAPRGGRIPNKKQDDVLFEMQANHQRHEHKSTRYRELFTYAIVLLILFFGLNWTSSLERLQLAEFGKVIVNSVLLAAIAYAFYIKQRPEG